MAIKEDLIKLNVIFLLNNFNEDNLRKMLNMAFDKNSITKESIEYALKKISEEKAKDEAFKALENKIDSICLKKERQ